MQRTYFAKRIYKIYIVLKTITISKYRHCKARKLTINIGKASYKYTIPETYFD